MYAQNTLENKQLPWVNTLKFNVGKTEFFFFYFLESDKLTHALAQNQQYYYFIIYINYLLIYFQIVVKFQPRDVGEYEQSWDLLVSPSFFNLKFVK